MTVGVMWFRRDLRLADNPAWATATGEHDTVVPLFVVDPRLWDACAPRRVALLAGHLRALDGSIRHRGGRLRVVVGDPSEVVPEVVRSSGAAAVHASADVTPFAATRDAAVGARVPLSLHPGQLIHPPGTILTGAGDRYRVFTPFSKRWFDTPLPDVPSEGLATLTSDPGSGVPETPPPPMEPGEAAALDRLDRFDPDSYADVRDRPDLDATSRLSIDLKFGTIGARTVMDAVGTDTPSRKAFVRQLAWRDFHAHLLDEMPHLVNRAMKPAYDDVRWREDPSGFEAWTRGRTGFPIVDAGMRQLATEGWMHNRVRMIAASFLVKDLLIDWRRGERWFRRTLLDGDVAQNVGNWQWVAGSGADAAPYFRIFNPVTQSRRFDPSGDYIRRWVPELRGAPDSVVHTPWEAGPLERATWADEDGEPYPDPIVDHADARRETLAAYADALGD